MNASPSFEAGAARSVDVVAIEQELARMWAAAKPESGSGVVRATLCNLIVLAGTDEADATTAVAEIAAAVPHRALVVLEGADATEVEAWISAHCRRTGPASQVCCEQVTVRAARAASARVASTVLALRVPDLPVVCWLRNMTDMDAPLLDRLGRHLDRLVVDGVNASAADFVALEAWQRAHPDVAVADLAWEHIAVWRELVAGSFDGAPFETLLDDIASVRIVHGARVRGAAALLVGWLASRLGWRAESSSLCRDAAGSAIAIECTVAESARDLESISITMRDGARCDVRCEAEDAVVAKLEHAQACAVPRIVPQRQVGDAAWVVRVLQRPLTNVAYAEALAAAAGRAGCGDGAAPGRGVVGGGPAADGPAAGRR